MGWTVGEKPQNVLAMIRELLTWEAEGYKNVCLDLAMVSMKTIYAAVERTTTDGQRDVWAAVFAIDFRTSKEHGYKSTSFGYKDMDETMGPFERNCPERILNLLTPTNNLNANEWRASCRRNIELRKARSVSNGQHIKFDRPIRFSNGLEAQIFRVHTGGNRVRFEAIDDYGYHRFFTQISNYKKKVFKVLEEDEIPHPPMQRL